MMLSCCSILLIIICGGGGVLKRWKKPECGKRFVVKENEA